jgi:hypothetical protein
MIPFHEWNGFQGVEYWQHRGHYDGLRPEIPAYEGVTVQDNLTYAVFSNYLYWHGLWRAAINSAWLIAGFHTVYILANCVPTLNPILRSKSRVVVVVVVYSTGNVVLDPSLTDGQPWNAFMLSKTDIYVQKVTRILYLQ